MQFKKVVVALLLLLTLSQVAMAWLDFDPIAFFIQMQTTAQQLGDATANTTLCAWEAVAKDKPVDHCGITLDQACGIIKPYLLEFVKFGTELDTISEILRTMKFHNRCSYP